MFLMIITARPALGYSEKRIKFYTVRVSFCNGFMVYELKRDPSPLGAGYHVVGHGAEIEFIDKNQHKVDVMLLEHKLVSPRPRAVSVCSVGRMNNTVNSQTNARFLGNSFRAVFPSVNNEQLLPVEPAPAVELYYFVLNHEIKIPAWRTADNNSHVFPSAPLQRQKQMVDLSVIKRTEMPKTQIVFGSCIDIYTINSG